MKYRVIISERALRDHDEAFEWYSANFSPEIAATWYELLHEALETLHDHPLRCARSREDGLFDFEVRELLIGKGRKNHRALFRTDGETVVVLHIRHTGRRDLQQGDL